MNKGNIDKWLDIESCQNLLFFAQVINELIFDFSISSFRVPTLNSHYLCLDAFSAIEGVKKSGAPERTLKPIVEELYKTLENDAVFDESNSPLKYFIKMYKGKAKKIVQIDELNFEECCNIVETIYNKFFDNNQYINLLKDKITLIVKKNNLLEQESLYKLTRSLITELINAGYDQRYIYDIMKHTFFNKKTTVKKVDKIDTFFNKFNMDNKEFSVMVIANKDILKMDKYFEGIKKVKQARPRTTEEKEKEYLTIMDNQTFLIYDEIPAYDPYSAAEFAKMNLEMQVALYRLWNHYYNIDIKGFNCIVYDEKNYFTYVAPNISPVLKAKTLSNDEIIDKFSDAQKLIENNGRDIRISFFRSISLHSICINTDSEENQLLDLWAIIEATLNINNQHGINRINQVCSYLVPILKSKYIFSLFNQLAEDINQYNNDLYLEIVKKSRDRFEECFEIFKFVVLDENQKEREQFLADLNDYPLLKSRINYYNIEFNTYGKLADYIDRHSKRVEWQLNRIYRNRNLIIHNGNKMPYINLLNENLHSYVDDMINYIIDNSSDGGNLTSMKHILFAKECEMNELLGKKKEKLDEKAIKQLLYY